MVLDTRQKSGFEREESLYCTIYMHLARVKVAHKTYIAYLKWFLSCEYTPGTKQFHVDYILHNVVGTTNQDMHR
jgi:hypothetical protein